NLMTIKPFLSERISRYKKFFADESPGQILGVISPYTLQLDYPKLKSDKTLREWDLENNIEKMIAQNVLRLRYFLQETKELENDFIPSLHPGLGIGLNSAYYSGAEIKFGDTTSWVEPVIKDWSDLQKLAFNKENKWYKYLVRMSKKLTAMNDGDYFIQTFAHFSPLDMAQALRGEQLFFDFYDHPQWVKKLLESCTRAIVSLEKELREVINQPATGLGIWGMWLPGQPVFMSEDIADICQQEVYREFAFPFSQKVIDTFDGGFIHHHAKGLHQHQEIVKLSGIKAIEISLDPNTERPIDHMEQLLAANEGIPLMTRCYPRDVYDNIEVLKKGRVILMLQVDSINEGQEVMEFIRSHSKV
ncbi:MAG: hypothetical protein ACOC2O_03130, partial [Bacillota bacterium]